VVTTQYNVYRSKQWRHKAILKHSEQMSSRITWLLEKVEGKAIVFVFSAEILEQSIGADGG
jgi:hypothetical protein